VLWRLNAKLRMLSIYLTNDSTLKSTLAGIEGEAGGHARGESALLQKSIREITSESKLKEAEIQKLKDVCSVFFFILPVARQKTRSKIKGRKGEISKSDCRCRPSHPRRELRAH